MSPFPRLDNLGGGCGDICWLARLSLGDIGALTGEEDAKGLDTARGDAA